jgi:hypothetical protein
MANTRSGLEAGRWGIVSEDVAKAHFFIGMNGALVSLCSEIRSTSEKLEGPVSSNPDDIQAAACTRCRQLLDLMRLSRNPKPE